MDLSKVQHAVVEGDEGGAASGSQEESASQGTSVPPVESKSAALRSRAMLWRAFGQHPASRDLTTKFMHMFIATSQHPIIEKVSRPDPMHQILRGGSSLKQKAT